MLYPFDKPFKLPSNWEELHLFFLKNFVLITFYFQEKQSNFNFRQGEFEGIPGISNNN